MPLPPERRGLLGALYDWPNGLLSTPPAQPNSLLGMAGLLNSPPAPPLGTLASSANAFYPPSGSLGGSYLGAVARRVAPKKRRVFFSFHYQDDVNQSSIVRQSWRFRPDDGTQPDTFIDHSVWEDAKTKGSTALKNLTHREMEGSTVSCTLAGRHTWARPWVRYEIAYGLARGNGLLNVHIHSVNNFNAGPSAPGPNPLDQMGLKWHDDGKAYIWEWCEGVWRQYSDYRAAVSWPSWLPNVPETRFVRQFSAGAKSYDWSSDNGSANLGHWAQLAAQQAGR